jgi:hypothetical protein
MHIYEEKGRLNYWVAEYKPTFLRNYADPCPLIKNFE